MARVIEVVLDRARTKWPGTPATVIVTVQHLSDYVVRPVAFQHGIYDEVFRVVEYHGSWAKAEYVGLRRSYPLMSETEKRLDPQRFPA